MELPVYPDLPPGDTYIADDEFHALARHPRLFSLLLVVRRCLLRGEEPSPERVSQLVNKNLKTTTHLLQALEERRILTRPAGGPRYGYTINPVAMWRVT